MWERGGEWGIERLKIGVGIANSSFGWVRVLIRMLMLVLVLWRIAKSRRCDAEEVAVEQRTTAIPVILK